MITVPEILHRIQKEEQKKKKGHTGINTAPNEGCAETFWRCNRCQIISNQRVFKSLNEKLCEH